MIINTKKLNCIGFIGYLFAIFFLFLSLIALGGMLPFIIGGLVMVVFSFLVRIEAASIKKTKKFWRFIHNYRRYRLFNLFFRIDRFNNSSDIFSRI